jgi:hypothetical protein
MEIKMSLIMQTTSKLTGEDRRVWLKARLGIDRMGHRVEPGLYSLGKPDRDSPVFVTANYKLSFDALRSQLGDTSCYILVLNTEGINVWCAAGKGTFGTEELIRKIESTNLKDVVNHRTLTLPQLGAPGVAAPEVRKRTGFKVNWGPTRASDIPEYLRTRKATEEMREVRFDLRDRMEVIPVEIKNIFAPLVVALIVLFLLGMRGTAFVILAIVAAGIVVFPILLPFLPTHDFASKGFVLGVVASMPFMGRAYFASMNEAPWVVLVFTLIPALMISPWVAFLALNFTGSTTFTSRTGVRREIFRYIPLMAVTFILGIGLEIGFAVAQWYGVI